MYSLESRKPAPMDLSTSDEEEAGSASDDDHNHNHPAGIRIHQTSSEEDESSSSDDEGIEEITDYNQIRQIIDAMDDDEGFGGGAGMMTGATAATELFGDQPIPEITTITVTATDSLTQAGTIMSVIEGMVVVRAAAGSRALAEGTVLVLEDRTVLGVVEEVFGPVTAPLYAMRYIVPTTSNVSGGDNDAKEGTPDIVVAEDEEEEQKQQQSAVPALQPRQDMIVFAVERLSEYLLPEALRVKGYDGDAGEEGEDEPQFSDDEQVT